MYNLYIKQPFNDCSYRYNKKYDVKYYIQYVYIQYLIYIYNYNEYKRIQELHIKA
jgi:hypothetical protein